MYVGCGKTVASPTSKIALQVQMYVMAGTKHCQMGYGQHPSPFFSQQSFFFNFHIEKGWIFPFKIFGSAWPPPLSKTICYLPGWSILKKQTNMPEYCYRASSWLFFKHNISVIPTCLTFAFRHQNLYNYAVTREKYAKEPSLFFKVLLATTNLLPCLVSHILFPMFPIVRNSEPMFRNQ